MPKIIEKSISILSDAGLGMAMFSLGGSHFSLSLSLSPVSISKFLLPIPYSLVTGHDRYYSLPALFMPHEEVEHHTSFVKKS
jgi:Membrane transport protein